MSNLLRASCASNSFRKSSNFALLFAIFLVAVALCPALSYSQAANAGTVAGIVTDSSGAIIVGATMTLTDKSTNTPRTEVSNDAGRYVFPNVPPGTYSITANKSGFRVAKVNEIKVSV